MMTVTLLLNFLLSLIMKSTNGEAMVGRKHWSQEVMMARVVSFTLELHKRNLDMMRQVHSFPMK